MKMGQSHPNFGGHHTSWPTRGEAINPHYNYNYSQRQSQTTLQGQENFHSDKKKKYALSNIPSSSVFLPEYGLYSFRGHGFSTWFKKEEKIAKGAFGNVLRVQRCKDGIHYAVKIMMKSKLVAEHSVQQSKDEASILNTVADHPFIVKSHWFFQDSQHLYIVMDYMHYGELFTLWKRQNYFHESSVRIMIAELALVLDYLHQNGIIYRDLKMENILIDDQGHLQVIDFGLAKRLPLGKRTRTICGTLQYMAPEVLNGMPYSHAADWWTLGVLMYTLLVGQYPASGARNHKEMAAMVTYPQLFDLPSHYDFTWQARQCNQKLLQFDPSERISSSFDLQRLPFFHDLDFSTVYNRKVSPLAGYLSKKSCKLNQDLEMTSANEGDITGNHTKLKSNKAWSSFDEVLTDRRQNCNVKKSCSTHAAFKHPHSNHNTSSDCSLPKSYASNESRANVEDLDLKSGHDQKRADDWKSNSHNTGLNLSFDSAIVLDTKHSSLHELPYKTSPLSASNEGIMNDRSFITGSGMTGGVILNANGHSVSRKLRDHRDHSLLLSGYSRDRDGHLMDSCLDAPCNNMEDFAGTSTYRDGGLHDHSQDKFTASLSVNPVHLSLCPREHDHKTAGHSTPVRGRPGEQNMLLMSDGACDHSTVSVNQPSRGDMTFDCNRTGILGRCNHKPAVQRSYLFSDSLDRRSQDSKLVDSISETQQPCEWSNAVQSRKETFV